MTLIDPTPYAVPRTAEPVFSVRTAHHRGSFVVAPYGELDLATADELERELLRAERSDAAEIVLDLTGLTFIDSTGIRLVLEADARSRGDGDRLKLLPGCGHVHGVFRLCGLADRLPFVA